MEVGVVWRLGLEAHLFKGLTTRQAACRTVQARVRSRVRCDSSPGAPPLCHTGGRQCPATKVPGRRVCKRAGQGKASAEATDLSFVHGSQQRAAHRVLQTKLHREGSAHSREVAIIFFHTQTESAFQLLCVRVIIGWDLRG